MIASFVDGGGNNVLEPGVPLNEKPFDSQLYWQSYKLFHVTPGTIFSDYQEFLTIGE